MGEVITKILREYNLLAAVFTAFFAMALGLGWFTLTPEQTGLVFGFIAAVLLLIRFAVTPTASPVLEPGTLVNEQSSLPTSRVVPLTEIK
jgi:hypothetical protein